MKIYPKLFNKLEENDYNEVQSVLIGTLLYESLFQLSKTFTTCFYVLLNRNYTFTVLTCKSVNICKKRLNIRLNIRLPYFMCKSKYSLKCLMLIHLPWFFYIFLPDDHGRGIRRTVNFCKILLSEHLRKNWFYFIKSIKNIHIL